MSDPIQDAIRARDEETRQRYLTWGETFNDFARTPNSPAAAPTMHVADVSDAPRGTPAEEIAVVQRWRSSGPRPSAAFDEKYGLPQLMPWIAAAVATARYGATQEIRDSADARANVMIAELDSAEADPVAYAVKGLRARSSGLDYEMGKLASRVR